MPDLGAKQEPGHPVIAVSNGHHRFVLNLSSMQLTCCRDCGVVWRADDRNPACIGIVRVALREVTHAGIA
jgi:hypothetical protein